jgi:hypothetical protein
MTNDEVSGLKLEHPDAFAVWQDRMFETPHSILIENLLRFMPYGTMQRVLVTIQKEIEHERRKETKQS